MYKFFEELCHFLLQMLNLIWIFSNFLLFISFIKLLFLPLTLQVFYDLDNTMPRIERPHGDDLHGEPTGCECCPPPMSGHRMVIVGNHAYV